MYAHDIGRMKCKDKALYDVTVYSLKCKTASSFHKLKLVRCATISTITRLSLVIQELQSFRLFISGRAIFPSEHLKAF